MTLPGPLHRPFWGRISPRPDKLLWAVPLALATLALGGCRGDFDPGDPGLVLDVGLSPTPPTVGSTRVLVFLQDTLGTPLEGALVEVEGNMSHAGMVPVLDTAVAEGPGRYVIPDFRFSMAGDWILTLRATLPDGRWAMVRSTTGVVGAPPRTPGSQETPEEPIPSAVGGGS